MPSMQWRAAQLHFFLGTLAPFLRASDRPMAMACLRLVTTPPLPPFPERSLPRFSLCIAFLTLSLAALPYFAMSPPEACFSEFTAKGSSCDPRITLSSDELECRNQSEKIVTERALVNESHQLGGLVMERGGRTTTGCY